MGSDILVKREFSEQEIMMLGVGAYTLPLTGIHGPVHWMNVFFNAVKLDPSGSHRMFYWKFAMLHDCCRKTELHCSAHGSVAAERFKDILDYDLLWAIRLHTDGSDKSAPGMVKTCWDADALDIGRVGIAVDPEMLRTEQAKLLNEQRRKQAEKGISHAAVELLAYGTN